MPRVTAFSVGRQYRCETDETRRGDKETFNFVVIGKAVPSNYKLCFLRVDPQDRRPYGRASMVRTTTTYPHTHLKKYGKLLDDVVDPLAFEHDGVGYRLEVDAQEKFGSYAMRLVRREDNKLIDMGFMSTFDTKDPVFGARRQSARLSTGTIVDNPNRNFRTDVVSFDLEYHAWKAWLCEVLGAEKVVIPFIDE